MSTAVLGELGQSLELTWFDHQLETFEGWESLTSDRACLYFKTGSGKTITSLTMMKLRDIGEVVVVAPPSTHKSWQEWADKFNIGAVTISHAKFRQKGYKLSRHQAIIVDEFHMLGGHTGAGWKKLDMLARHLQAPLIICSATPNYNDAERVYCIKHVLDPHGTKGGYLEFLYQNCITEQNPFGQTPNVTGFQRYPDAAAFLADLPGVYYLPDDLVYTIEEHDIWQKPLPELEHHRYNRRKHKMVASLMEERHTLVQQHLIKIDGRLNDEVLAQVEILLKKVRGPVLIFANHATVAVAVAKSLDQARHDVALVTGDTKASRKDEWINEFRKGDLPILVGTTTLATGTDGLDKVCDTLIIVDDTDDDALRRQLIGRIMPRGADTDASKKQVHRINAV